MKGRGEGEGESEGRRVKGKRIMEKGEASNPSLCIDEG